MQKHSLNAIIKSPQNKNRKAFLEYEIKRDLSNFSENRFIVFIYIDILKLNTTKKDTPHTGVSFLLCLSYFRVTLAPSASSFSLISLASSSGAPSLTTLGAPSTPPFYHSSSSTFGYLAQKTSKNASGSL